MLLKKKQQEQEALKSNSIQGIYVPRQKRVEQKQEISKVHFQLGHQNQKFTVTSTAQDLFSGADLSHAQDNAQTKQINADLVKASRNSNFKIGSTTNPVFYKETSASTAFSSTQFENRDKNGQGEAPNMRGTNFNLGHDRLSYRTSTAHNNQQVLEDEGKSMGPEMMATRKKAQFDRVQKNRVQNYSYGRDTVNYQSVAKHVYNEKNLSQAISSRQEREQNGKDLRKTHFLFGTDQNPHHKHQSTQSQVASARGMQQPTMLHKSTPSCNNIYNNNNNSNLNNAKSQIALGNNNNATNIQIQHQGVAAGPVGQTRFQSSYGSSNYHFRDPVSLAKIHQVRSSSTHASREVSAEAASKKPNENNDMKSDLRKSHFVLGVHKPDYSTHTMRTHAACEVPQNQEQSRLELKARMAKAQFAFGNSKENTGMRDARSMYVSQIDTSAKMGAAQIKESPNKGSHTAKTYLKSSHFSLGCDRPVTATEAQSQFKNVNNPACINSENKNIVEKMKKQNYSLYEQKQGGMVNNYFMTSHKTQFNAKGNPAEIRAKMGDNQKADGSASHFQVGFEPQFRSQVNQIHNLQARPTSASRTTTPMNAATKLGAGNTTPGSLKPGIFYGQAAAAKAVAKSQQKCHITFGGASSKAKANQGELKTSNQSFFRWIQPRTDQ